MFYLDTDYNPDLFYKNRIIIYYCYDPTSPKYGIGWWFICIGVLSSYKLAQRRRGHIDFINHQPISYLADVGS